MIFTAEQGAGFLRQPELAADTEFQRLCAEVNAECATAFGREFTLGERIEYPRGNGYSVAHGASRLFLREDPVESISEVAVCGAQTWSEPESVTVVVSAQYRIAERNVLCLFDLYIPDGLSIVRVTYRAGYDPLPADVVGYALRQLAKRQAIGSREEFKSERLGDVSYERFAVGESQTDANVLARYRRRT